MSCERCESTRNKVKSVGEAKYDLCVKEKRYVCPYCGQVYLTGFEGPGSYWEEEEDIEKGKDEVKP
jgi:transposase-like protein